MTSRKINFNPGPGRLPLAVLERAQQEMVDFQETGMSIMEHSHRGPAFLKVHAEVKALLRELMAIPDSHEVLFMQGGARAQFALVPMNLLPPGTHAEYLNTGVWGEQALAEAQLLGSAREAFSSKDAQGVYTRVPGPTEVSVDPAAAYVHITTNNTLYGTQYHAFPETGAVPLIADMSSDICCQPIDVSKFGLIYAGAQKNLGPAGVTLVIARKDLIDKSSETIPKIFRYSVVAKADSLQNTPPTFAIYFMRNVLEWIRDSGGLANMQQRNQGKAELLYQQIDRVPDFYRSPAERESRSIMNVTFTLPSKDLETQFLEGAEQRNMVGLKGHRAVGGVRASIYNAMEPEGVQALASYMEEFAVSHGA